MARSPTTLDTFSAVAEPRRRRVLELLAEGELPVQDVTRRLGWPQPVVSKHLGVLREVGLVDVRQEGRQRMYRVNGERLKTIYDWVRTFEVFWSNQLAQIKARAEAKAKAKKPPDSSLRDSKPNEGKEQ